MIRQLCVIPGDGIGSEVVDSAVRVFIAASEMVGAVEVDLHYFDAGWQTFLERGVSVPMETLQGIRNIGAALFGAVSSPSEEVVGYRSAILAIRQELKLFANLRQVKGEWSNQPRDDVDFLIVRENSEGLYLGRERWIGDEAVAEKIVTKAASVRLAEVAAEIAVKCGWDRLMIVHKANVLPITEGLFRDSVKEVLESRAISVEEGLVDIVAHNLIAEPESFEMLVTTNMFGDILSDLAAWWCGGMGRAPSLNLGSEMAVAEPVHGSAPDIAGRGIADPSATILSLAMLCRYHWNDWAMADLIEEATVAAIRQYSDRSITTEGFTHAVVSNLAVLTKTGPRFEKSRTSLRLD